MSSQEREDLVGARHQAVEAARSPGEALRVLEEAGLQLDRGETRARGQAHPRGERGVVAPDHGRRHRVVEDQVGFTVLGLEHGEQELHGPTRSSALPWQSTLSKEMTCRRLHTSASARERAMSAAIPRDGPQSASSRLLTIGRRCVVCGPTNASMKSARCDNWKAAGGRPFSDPTLPWPVITMLETWKAASTNR